MYLALKGTNWTLPAAVLGIFGAVLPALAVALTRKAAPAPVIVARPNIELASVLGFLPVIYAIVFLGWGMSPTPGRSAGGARTRSPGPGGQACGPCGALRRSCWRCSAPNLVRCSAAVFSAGFWPPLIVLSAIILALMCVISPALSEIAALHASAMTLAWTVPGAFVWMAVEAGLCEEFLFRAVLQPGSLPTHDRGGSRVDRCADIRLAHAPGLYLRGKPGVDGFSTDLIQVIAFTVAMLSPVALLFATLWARTRSLLLIVLLHAVVDVLPNLPDFVRTWAR